MNRNDWQLLPSVTVAIPTYNESQYIKKILEIFLQTTYPHLIEIIVADGGSTDGTQEIVKQIAQADQRIKLLNNPLKVQSAALNLILSEAKGEIFLRADAHCDYSNDYVEKCVEVLLASEALNVGGAQRFVALDPFQAGIALASRSWLGNGGAKYRDPTYNGYADTVFLGCFWTQDLLEESGYCVESTPNEDAELNLRLLKKQKDAIYVSSKIKVWYFPRKNFQGLFKQYYKYGKARYLTSKKHFFKSPLRSQIPFIFLVCLCIFILMDFYIFRNILHLVLIIFALFFLIILESLRMTLKFSDNFDKNIWRNQSLKSPGFVKKIFFCSQSLAIMLVAYSIGYAIALIKNFLSLRQVFH